MSVKPNSAKDMNAIEEELDSALADLTNVSERVEHVLSGLDAGATLDEVLEDSDPDAEVKDKKEEESSEVGEKD